MEKTGKHKKRFGLVGRNISYSFSRGYFSEKFEKMELLDHSYENFDLQDIQEIENVLQDKSLGGLNVTIPYKEEVIPYLTTLDETAAKIGAVNTIKFTENGTKGFNTDAHGFKESLLTSLEPHHKKALILGTGGASKAIAHVLSELGIGFQFVSRNPEESQLSYSDLTPEVMDKYFLVINCTPLGTHPNTEACPNIPYQLLSDKHFLFDLIYNPSKTRFLELGEAQGATIQNGLPMLQNQAEKAWEIWNS